MDRPDWQATPDLKPDAMRFTRGNPAHASLYVLVAALDYLEEVETLAVLSHVQGLTTALLAAFEGLGLPVTTPADPAQHGASVCIALPDADRIVTALEDRAGILAWGGRGRVRFSFHGYNSDRDVAAIADAMRALVPA
jgi:selenocysteine lyase/cysteine desulfurase